MGRRVIVELPDGSVQPVNDVPDNISNESVGKRYGGKVMSVTEDVLRSGASGVPFGITQLFTMPQKAMVGAGIGLGFEEQMAPLARSIHRGEQERLKTSGGAYAPRTKAGEYAKSATAAAIPIPGLGPPGTQAVLGGISGLLGQAASDAGLGTSGALMAEMFPFLGHGIYKGLKPAAPARHTRDALANLLPEERATMEARMNVARENNLPLMPWQAAPEGSELRNLGQRVAQSQSSYPTRKIQGQQALAITGNQDLIPPAAPATRRISGPMYEKSAEVPIKPETAGRIYESILAIKKEKRLAPDSPQSKVIDKVASQFGEFSEVPVADRIENITKQIRTLPKDSPEIPVLRAKVRDLINGTTEPEMVFKPAGIDNYGQVQNIYQNPKIANLDAGVDVDKATKLWIRNAIARVADKDNPLFASARQKHREVSDLIKTVEKTDVRGSSGLNVASEAKIELAPDLVLAAGANPVWASVPVVRDWIAKQSVKEYNKGFGSTSLKDLMDLSRKYPRVEAVQSFVNSLLQPVKQGEFEGLLGPME